MVFPNFQAILGLLQSPDFVAPAWLLGTFHVTGMHKT
jgi:hypothetical protein